MIEPTRDRILVLGLGNDILTDDAAGLIVARLVRERLAGESEVEVRESMEMGLTLLDHVSGFQKLVLIDSIQTRTAPPGHIHTYPLEDYRGLNLSTPHFLGLADTFSLAKRLGLPMPDEADVFAIEANDVLTLSVSMTPEVERAVPVAVEMVVEHVHQFLALHAVDEFL